MSVKRSPVPTPDIFRPTHSTKKERRTPKQRRPPKLKRRMHAAPRLLFSQDAKGISFSTDDDTSSSSITLYKHYPHLTYFRQNFDNVTRIGEGSFGEVFSVRCKKTGHFYAVKKSKERFRSELDRKLKLEEVRKHELIPKHENCVEFIGAWEEDEYLYIQLELCRMSLEEYTEVHHEVAKKMLWNILLDMLLAVKHLHDLNLVHLDIKLENILLSMDGVFKLGDFGLVIDLSKALDDPAEGDPKYLAPELMTGHFTKAADIFSVGITMLELASDLDLPSGGPLWHELRNGIFPDKHTKHICPDLFVLIKLMMTPEYVNRPSVDSLLSHPHLRKMMMWRRRYHYVNQVVTQVQSLYNMGCAALKSVVDIVLFPLGYLQTGSHVDSTMNDYFTNNSFIDDTDRDVTPSDDHRLRNGRLNASTSSSIGVERNDMNLSASTFNDGERNGTNVSTDGSVITTRDSPNLSPINGKRQPLLNLSIPELLINNSTPSTTPPNTPRKRSLESVQDGITPISTRNKRLCTSSAEIHSFELRSRMTEEVSPVGYESVLSKASRGVCNLLPYFGHCEQGRGKKKFESAYIQKPYVFKSKYPRI